MSKLDDTLRHIEREAQLQICDLSPHDAVARTLNAFLATPRLRRYLTPKAVSDGVFALMEDCTLAAVDAWVTDLTTAVREGEAARAEKKEGPAGESPGNVEQGDCSPE